jgi:hypothetical protein
VGLGLRLVGGWWVCRGSLQGVFWNMDFLLWATVHPAPCVETSSSGEPSGDIAENGLQCAKQEGQGTGMIF